MRPSAHRHDPASPRWILPVLLTGLLIAFPTQGAVRNVFPGSNAITSALHQSAPGDSILVHPGLYPFETGSEISHPLTVIGIGGASANEVRICTDLCQVALFDVQPQAGSVDIEGLTMTRNHNFPGFVKGVEVHTADVTVRNCTFFDLVYPGVYVCTAGTVRIEHNLFLGQGSERGSGVGFCPGGVANIVGNTFVRSSIGITQDAAPRLNGNIIYQTEVICGAGATPTFACNDSWQSTYQGSCSNPTGTNNNFSADPLFCDPDAPNYGLLPGSPCLPENSPAGCGLVGANGPCEVLAVSDPAGSPSLSRLEVSPNPSSGEIVFSMPGVTTPRTLEIFDAHGRQVDVLRPMAGQITWNPSRDLTKGVYFARITSPSSAVVKFVLLR